MDRRQFVSAMFTLASSPLLASQDASHPVVNDDSAKHGMKPAGVNRPTEHVREHRVPAPASSGVQAITTRSGSNLRYGAYHETRLTPDAVRGGLRKVGQLTMTNDARGMDAQPLFAPGIMAKGKRRDLVLCATMANRVYAFDSRTMKLYGWPALENRCSERTRSITGEPTITLE
jgi:hypothetical protein